MFESKLGSIQESIILLYLPEMLDNNFTNSQRLLDYSRNKP